MMNFKRVGLSLFLSLLFFLPIKAQETKSTKVVLITLDGLRWQELFSGADSLLVANEKYVNDTTGLKKSFWRKTPEQRREALMPFFWNEVSKLGQLHGNRNLNNKVDLANKQWFSYPGYNEILTGRADDERINSNDKINNPNTTVLEIANKDPRYMGKVAAFASWDVFPYIVNEERSGVPVNAGFDIAEGDDLTPREIFLNELQPKVPSPWSTVRLDAFTHHYALEYMKKVHPEFIYIAYGETDDFAHDGDYEAYLKAASNTDLLIKQLWDYTQNEPFYKDRTLFIISTDHGRGTNPLKEWKGHGNAVKDAGGVWLVVFGAGISPKGEMTTEKQLYSSMIAPTIATVLDLHIDSVQMEEKPLNLWPN